MGLTPINWPVINIVSDKVKHDNICFVQLNNTVQDFGQGEKKLSQTRQLLDTAVFI